MKRILVLVLLFNSFSVIAQHLIKQPLMAIVENEEKGGNLSGTVLIAKADSVIFEYAAGFADRENGLKNEIDTKFNIASVGKLFTRIIILQLESEGKLGLHDPIDKYFTGFSEDKMDQITIFHLLEHRSGLGDITVSKAYEKEEVFSSPERVISEIAKEKPAFTPGTDNKYSNSGYYLLGALISKLTGLSLAEAMQQRIFSKLGMENSGFAKTGDVVDRHAFPYKIRSGTIKRSVIKPRGEPPSGAGSQYSTVRDLHKVFLSLVRDNILLDDARKALLFNRFQPGDWNQLLHTKKIVGYLGGDTRGWSAKLSFMFFENTVYTVIICSNLDDRAHPLDLKLREQILNQLTQ